MAFHTVFGDAPVRCGRDTAAANSVCNAPFQRMRERDSGTCRAADADEITGVRAEHPPFSVAMSVYGKDNAEWFDCALASIIVKQSIQPSEVVLVVDGPVPTEIQNVIEKYTEICGDRVAFKVIFLRENRGLGEALRVAVEGCKYDLIARMDSDDIAEETRFAQQLAYFARHGEVDILGGDIVEFVDAPSNRQGKRAVPGTDREIKEYMKRRCPLNHMTVMFKKNAVMRAGGYREWHYNEDYYLWIRMLQHGAVFANTETVLVNVRVGRDMYKRRGGWRYFKSEAALQLYMRKNRITGSIRCCLNVLERLAVQVLMPAGVRERVYKRLARD